VFREQWIYFPDLIIPFGRIMEPRNFDRSLSPEGKTSLFIEFFCWKDDYLWTSSKQSLLEITVPWLEENGFLKSDEIIDSYIHREEYAYPVYDLEYKMSRDPIMKYLSGLTNLQVIGRSGMFRYNNQDHAIEMGLLAAKNVIQGGRPFDIELVGTENKYFERGPAEHQ
jgi:protoporphyrinogen oxidase